MTDKVLASSAETSPDALLKQAILGARASADKAAAKPANPEQRPLHADTRLLGLSAAALALGVVLGAGAMRLVPAGATDGAALGQIRQQVEAARSESERQVERLTKSLAQLQDSAEATRSEAKARSATLAERLGRAEQTITTRIATMGDRLEQAEKDQSARLTALTTQIEKRAAAQAPVAPAAQAVVKPTAPEPTTTGALGDKPKSAPIETWAVREVYDGVAVLEDRKRRLVEVGLGDTVPGLGRVEAIDRRGKNWVVVTKQGTITPQAW